MKEELECRCLTCKWVYIGKYSHIYKGRPIGCVRPDKKKGNCWGPKEDKER